MVYFVPTWSLLLARSHMLHSCTQLAYIANHKNFCLNDWYLIYLYQIAMYLYNQVLNKIKIMVRMLSRMGHIYDENMMKIRLMYV